MTPSLSCAGCIHRRELVDGQGFDWDRCVRFPPVFCGTPVYGMVACRASRVDPEKRPDVLEALQLALKPPDQSVGWFFPPALQRCGEYREAP